MRILRADRSTWPVRGQISTIVRAAGGSYDAGSKGWTIPDEAYERVAGEVAQLKAPEQGRARQTSGAALQSHGYFDPERQHFVHILTNPDHALGTLENERLQAALAAAEIVETGYLFSTKAALDEAKHAHAQIVKDLHHDALVEQMKGMPGISFADPATYCLREEYKALGGVWVRVGTDGFWNFPNAENGTEAQLLLADLRNQAPSIVDPNAQYVRRELADLGYYDSEKEAWVIKSDAALEQANALVGDVRKINAKTQNKLRFAIDLLKEQGLTEFAVQTFGFNPYNDPEVLDALDRYNAERSLEAIEKALTEKEINLTREFNKLDRETYARKPSELVTGAASKHGDQRERPSVGDYVPQPDEALLAQEAAVRSGHPEDERQIKALIGSVKEQLGLSMDPNTIVFGNAGAGEEDLVVGRIVAKNQYYLLQRSERLVGGIPEIRYAVHARSRFFNASLNDDAKIQKLIDSQASISVGRQNGVLIAIKTPTTDLKHQYAESMKILSAAVEKAEREGRSLEKFAAAATFHEDQAAHDALVAEVLPQLREEHVANRRDAEVLFHQRNAQAESEGRVTMETLRIPADPKEMTLSDQSSVVHGKIIGDYGQGKAGGKTYKPPTSRDYFAVQDAKRSHAVWLYDARNCTDKFGEMLAIRRKYADMGENITVGFVNGNLVVAKGTINQRELEKRYAYFQEKTAEEGPRQIQSPARRTESDFEVGSYDNLMRQDLQECQRRGRETLASKLGYNLDQIRSSLADLGQQPTYEQLWQFAGINSHIVDPKAVVHMRGEVLYASDYHIALHITPKIKIGQTDQKMQQVAVLDRADIYLETLNRQPKIGETIEVTCENGIVTSCKPYDKQQIIEREKATLHGVLAPESVESFVSSREKEEQRSANIALKTLFPQIDINTPSGKQIEYVPISREGTYDGRVSVYIDPEGEKFYFQKLDGHRFAQHHATEIDANIEDGSWARIVYRDGHPTRTEEVSAKDLALGANIPMHAESTQPTEYELTIARRGQERDRVRLP